jgi:hypothetical protein
MQIDLPSGTTWHVRDAAKKLARRARLPGASLYDRAAASLRVAQRAGVGLPERFDLALPASWLVNSPAISKVLRRWASAPQRRTCLALLELLDGGPAGWARDPEGWAAVPAQVAGLGDEPYVVEASSKVFALLVPDAVPLMPPAARAFVLGAEHAGATGAAFVRIVEWFARAAAAHEPELARLAREHEGAELSAAAVLDRLLWFDSEGHKHFPE